MIYCYIAELADFAEPQHNDDVWNSFENVSFISNFKSVFFTTPAYRRIKRSYRTFEFTRNTCATPLNRLSIKNYPLLIVL